YQDEGLNPTLEYCYFIRSFGTHGVDHIKDPTINDSQVACDFAQDDEPPCPPALSVDGDCEDLIHQVRITKPTLDCDGDTDFLTLLFADNPSGPFREVMTIDYPDFGGDTLIQVDLSATPDLYAGCYAITATDTLGNTSAIDRSFCIDYCPELIMSNVFSPNGDGINDIFKPKYYRDVILKEIRIFDRWGRLMWSTSGDIGVLWEGQAFRENRRASEGVYYYHISYEELKLNGNIPKEKTGWVTLMR
ncbi:MAG: gliding motility-associated C-terminal domain-containing protein, partial [Bacteroidetes bacterium]|nr:gliding motility-associated C-terminal domain-containing protein [Bacteroidota bacterium]